ncbi:MAG: Crp/Fnr family transcriptional regulator [Rhodospirillales bacterium]
MNQVRHDIHSAKVPKICIACEARHGGVCGALNPSELLRISDFTTIRTLPAGTSLIAQGEAPRFYSNILSGVVKLTKLLSDGRQQIVGLQFAPDFVGRPFEKSSTLSAETATDVSICQVRSGDFEKMLMEFPGLEIRLHQQSLRALDDAQEWLLTLGRRSAREKVAAFIMFIMEHAEPSTPPHVEHNIILPLTRAEMADMLGLTMETVSRQLTALSSDGVIERAKGRVVIVRNLQQLSYEVGH